MVVALVAQQNYATSLINWFSSTVQLSVCFILLHMLNNTHKYLRQLFLLLIYIMS